MDHDNTDAELVAAWAAGDLRALTAVYDRYADALYAFALARTRSAADAADVVHDVFVRASGAVGQLRDAARLRAWLYAIARRRIYDLSRGRTAVNDDASIASIAAEGAEPEAGLVHDEARELVWQAAASLNDRDRDLLVLHLRHGLEGADLADVMGVTPAHVYTLVNRVKERMAKAVGALLVARHGRQDCEALAELLRGWDGRFTLEVRSRVTRHVESCVTCDRHRVALVAPANFAAGSLALPLLAPTGLRERTLAAAESALRAGQVGASGARDGSSSAHRDAARPWQERRAWRPDGFPRAPTRWSRIGLAATGAAAAAVVLLGAVVIVTGDDSLVTDASPARDPAATTTIVAAPVQDDAALPAEAAPAPTAPPGQGPVSDGTATEPEGGVPDAVESADQGIAADGDTPSAQERERSGAPPPIEAVPGSAPAGTSPVAPPGATDPGQVTPPPPGGTRPPATTAPAVTVPPTTVSPVAPSATTTPAATGAPPETTAPPEPAPAHLSLSASSLDLGASTTSASFTVTNTGGGNATLATTSSSGSFSVGNGSAVVAPGASATVTITVDRAALPEGSQSAQVSVSAPGATGGGSVVVVARVERGPTISSLVRTPPLIRTSISCGQTLTLVSVQLADESGIGSASVLWSSDGTFAQRTDLSLQSNGRWTASIGSFSKVGTNTLRVDVSDTRGNTSSATTTVDVVPC